jgi:hypothetical protein
VRHGKILRKSVRWKWEWEGRGDGVDGWWCESEVGFEEARC